MCVSLMVHCPVRGLNHRRVCASTGLCRSVWFGIYDGKMGLLSRSEDLISLLASLNLEKKKTVGKLGRVPAAFLLDPQSTFPHIQRGFTHPLTYIRL